MALLSHHSYNNKYLVMLRVSQSAQSSSSWQEARCVLQYAAWKN